MEIRNIAIIGTGLMGSGIAQLIGNSGFEVTLYSRKRKGGLERLHQGVEKAVNRRFLTRDEADLLLSHIYCTSSLRDAVKTADLIIEAVIEDFEVKKDVFRKIDRLSQQKTILASNTSSLSISALAKATNRPEKVVGMHFFNPAPAMKLVEVIESPQTSGETVSSVVTFAQKIGKFPLVVKDSPGFVVNRILMPAINTAAFILMEKVATAEAIDSAMKLGANHPMGPLALADLIGIDTCLSIMKELNSRLVGKFQICPLFEKMVSEGNLGKKTGKGFFMYETQDQSLGSDLKLKAYAKIYR